MLVLALFVVCGSVVWLCWFVVDVVMLVWLFDVLFGLCACW